MYEKTNVLCTGKQLRTRGCPSTHNVLCKYEWKEKQFRENKRKTCGWIRKSGLGIQGPHLTPTSCHHFCVRIVLGQVLCEQRNET